MHRTVIFALAALSAGAAAQDQPRLDPNDPQAKVPAVEYRSAFEGYRPFADPQVGDWRKANQEVGSAGGHAGHKPGQKPGQPTSRPAAGETKDAPGSKGHEGHK
jgi:hypothetical protein